MLRERMRAAEHVLVLTGAGVSAESGVPTFRGGGNTAVWKGMPFDVISSAGMLQRDLPAVWEWFNHRRDLLAALTPNPGHRTIAGWQNRFSDLSLVTQNIDGLHQAAGSRDVIELHGNIWRARCFDCDARYDLKEIKADNGVPSCFDCGGDLRPDVVLFGEMLPPGAFERAADAAQRCELCFVVGTSAVVYPAASIPEIARENGAYLVEVNPEGTPLSAMCHEVLTGKAGEILPRLSEARP
jgi:NAD-dependent deacetylase